MLFLVSIYHDFLLELKAQEQAENEAKKKTLFAALKLEMEEAIQVGVPVVIVHG